MLRTGVRAADVDKSACAASGGAGSAGGAVMSSIRGTDTSGSRSGSGNSGDDKMNLSIHHGLF